MTAPTTARAILAGLLTDQPQTVAELQRRSGYDGRYVRRLLPELGRVVPGSHPAAWVSRRCRPGRTSSQRADTAADRLLSALIELRAPATAERLAHLAGCPVQTAIDLLPGLAHWRYGPGPTYAREWSLRRMPTPRLPPVAELALRVLREAGRPMTVREVHEALGGSTVERVGRVLRAHAHEVGSVRTGQRGQRAMLYAAAPSPGPTSAAQAVAAALEDADGPVTARQLADATGYSVRRCRDVAAVVGVVAQPAVPPSSPTLYVAQSKHCRTTGGQRAGTG